VSRIITANVAKPIACCAVTINPSTTNWRYAALRSRLRPCTGAPTRPMTTQTTLWDFMLMSEEMTTWRAASKSSTALCSSQTNTVSVITRLAENSQESPEFSARLQRLQLLSEKRDALARKVRLCNTVQNHLEPLKTAAIQPNLVARDGPIADELTRAKTLGIRLTSRVARLKRGRQTRHKSPISRPAQQAQIIHRELAREQEA
jgi:hypothetical protein